MNKCERKITIVDTLKRENGLPVRLIAEQLGVSHMTVRRDVEELVSEDQVRLIHGGVILSPRITRGKTEERPYSLSEAEATLSDVKYRIGKRAAALIDDTDTLLIDIGSTTEYLAASLPQDKSLTVICFSLNIINRVVQMDQVKSVFTGGLLHKDTLMFESPEGLVMIRRHRATKAFISAAGVSLELGVTCRNTYERETKSAAIESAAQCILLADSSKFGAIRSNYFANINQFDVIVTDTGLDEAIRGQLEERQIEVILV